MIKKTTLFIAGILLFSGCSSSSGTKPEISEKSLTEKITDCKKTGFIDYTKTLSLSEKEQEDTIKNLKTTENSGDLEKYFCSQNRAWRAYTAQNIHTSPELLWFYSHDEEEVVRQYLASNRALPEDISQKLTRDADSVLYALARNPSLSEKILQEIFEKPANLKTQASLGYNRGTSEKFQNTLAMRLSDVKALQELAKNPNISEKTQSILKERNIPEVTKTLNSLNTETKEVIEKQ